MKVKEIIKFLEATDPECEVFIKIGGNNPSVNVQVDEVKDLFVGAVVITGGSS